MWPERHVTLSKYVLHFTRKQIFSPLLRDVELHAQTCQLIGRLISLSDGLIGPILLFELAPYLMFSSNFNSRLILKRDLGVDGNLSLLLLLCHGGGVSLQCYTSYTSPGHHSKSFSTVSHFSAFPPEVQKQWGPQLKSPRSCQKYPQGDEFFPTNSHQLLSLYSRWKFRNKLESTNNCF